MDKKSVLKYCDGFVHSEYNGLVIAANTISGMNFKMTKECFEIIDEFISRGLTVETFLGYIEDPDDRNYFEKLLGSLVKYEILVDINSDFPGYDISLEITSRCNLKCKHCCIDAGPDRNEKDLPFEEWKKIIDKLKELKIESVAVTGGEAMIRSDFFEISDYIRKTLNTKMQLMSNSLFINENNAERLLELYDDFSFSLDGADEATCSALRGPGVFDKVISNIKLMKKKGMKNFSVSMTEVRQNKDCVDNFKKMVIDLGGEPLIRNFDVVGRAKEHLELIPDDIDSCYRPFLPPYPEGFNRFPPNDMPVCISCSAFRRKFGIGADGSIYPCISMHHDCFKIGNICKIESLKNFFDGYEFKKTDGYRYFMEMHPAYSKECSDCPVKLFCDSCVQYCYLMKNNVKYRQFCSEKRKELMRIWE